MEIKLDFGSPFALTLGEVSLMFQLLNDGFIKAEHLSTVDIAILNRIQKNNETRKDALVTFDEEQNMYFPFCDWEKEELEKIILNLK